MKRISLLPAVLPALIACQNPFPQNGLIQSEAPKERRVVVPPYVLGASSVVEFLEGREGTVPLTVFVPEPGTPVLTASGLPDGATLSVRDRKVTWTPAADAANDSANPAINYRSYPVRFSLCSSEDPLTRIEKTITFIVRDVPRDLAIEAPSSRWRVSEGEELTQEIRIRSEDFPAGPFRMSAMGLPSGAEFTPDPADPAVFKLRYLPSYETVKREDSRVREFGISLAVLDPRGNTVKVDRVLTVYDVRQAPEFSVPERIAQGRKVSFAVMAQDANGEGAPTISAYPVNFGKLTLTSLDAGQHPGRSAALVTWDGIPNEYVGTRQQLLVQACVQYGFECTTRQIDVDLADQVVFPPAIDRSQWELGLTRYLKVGASERVPLEISDPQSKSADSVKVEIFPEEMRDFVSWQWGALYVDARAAGIQRFVVRATSPSGLTSSESFTFEALPSTWPEVLVLGDSYRDPETKATLALLDSAELMNPTLQRMDDRALAFRKMVVIGTSALQDARVDANALAGITSAATAVRRVIVGSPLVWELPGAFGEEIRSYGVSVRGRLTALSGAPALAEFRLFSHAQSGLTAPHSQVRLNAALTDESASPLIFDAIAASSACTPLFVMESVNPELSLLAGVSCPRTMDEGKVVLTGFEPGAVIPFSSEAGLVRQWMKELMKE